MKRVVLALLVAVLLVLLSVQTVSADPGSCRKIHVVRRGDTLYSIARRYGTTVNRLVRVNHIRNRNLIYRGQRLCIPKRYVPKKAGFWYKVRRGNTLYGISRRYHVWMGCVARANNIRHRNLIYTGQWLFIPNRCHR